MFRGQLGLAPPGRKEAELFQGQIALRGPGDPLHTARLHTGGCFSDGTRLFSAIFFKVPDCELPRGGRWSRRSPHKAWCKLLCVTGARHMFADKSFVFSEHL